MLTLFHLVRGCQVLRCVDWGDAQEARAAVELVSRWAPVGLADALELLSPAFTNPEVAQPDLLLCILLRLSGRCAGSVLVACWPSSAANSQRGRALELQQC